MASPERNIHQGAFVVPVLMSIRVLIVISLFTFCAVNSAIAQEIKPIQSASGPAITVAASADRVRFTSSNTVVQMHLQVYDNAGQLVFDVSSKGNVLDWSLQDSGGARLNPGSYLSVVTVKSLSGKLSQRIGSVSVQEKQLELQRVDAAQMTAGQQQAVGPIEENDALTILQAGETEATTVVAHDGTQGEVTRSRGALSFRLGDFFSGKDEEQMRLTEEGNLGIGTDSPQAKLDVAGVIRTSKGIEFGSGTKATKLTMTANGSLQQTLADGTVVANPTGTGTQNKIAKWTDNAGTLGDGGVYESGGLVVIGQNASGQVAPLATLSGQYHTLEVGVPPGGKSPLTLAGGSGVMEFWKDLGGGVGNPVAAVSFGMAVPGTPATNDMLYSSYTAGNQWHERMRLTNAGNLGIGTTAPTQKLEVAGNVKVSGNGNGLIFPDATMMTSAGIGQAQADARYAQLSAANSFTGNQSVTGNVNASGSISGGSGSFSGNLTADTNTLFVDATNHHVGIGTANPDGLQINAAVSEAARGADNARLGVIDGTPRIILEDAASPTQWEMDNFAGRFRIFTPGAEGFTIGSSGNVGIGTAAPTARLTIFADSASPFENTATFRAPNIGPNQSHIHYGTTGDWYIRSAANTGKVILQDSGGNVGIGTTNPSEKLTVAGTIQSTSGFKFPDGSVQTNAVGDALQASRSGGYEVAPNGTPATPMLQLSVPVGTYLFFGTAEFENDAALVGQNNSRSITCTFVGTSYSFRITAGGGTPTVVSWHEVKTVSQPTVVEIACVAFTGGTDRSYVAVQNRVLTAVRVSSFVQQQ